MSDTIDPKNEQDPAATGTPEGEAAAYDEVETVEAAEEVAEGATAIADELEDLRSRLLRTTADYQNFVKRSQVNQQAAIDQRIMSVTRDLVAVLDHFDRAGQIELEKVTPKDLLEGMSSIRGELLRVLNKYGVVPIEPEVGEVFDPNRHEALMRAEVEGVASNHVASVLQNGYALGDKTIRPAGVSVAP
ncbi:MAG: nucleotide exchange factor GrpE [Planctomycetota bacterium]